MIFHILTATLVVLKALEIITWSWWLVLAPSLITLSFTLIVLAVALFLTMKYGD